MELPKKVTAAVLLLSCICIEARSIRRRPPGRYRPSDRNRDDYRDPNFRKYRTHDNEDFEVSDDYYTISNIGQFISVLSHYLDIPRTPHPEESRYDKGKRRRGSGVKEMLDSAFHAMDIDTEAGYEEDSERDSVKPYDSDGFDEEGEKEGNERDSQKKSVNFNLSV
ncbi:hypothetical protein Y032_0601g515 [Ancylostoma ceylanicum]|nr:hypothetical protein Y032_0601g515 [Ancylostoma ceylanicum]